MAKKYASEMVKLAQSWIGKKESNGTHKEIIDIYNTYRPLPRGTKMQYDWAWCACTVSALAIKLGYTDIVPIEMSCSRMIALAKNMGIWVETDSITPTPGMFLLYDWDDNGKGENKGDPEHIGIVEKVANGKITVIEGNYGNAVKRRVLDVNGRYIRGYIAPKYDEEKKETSSTTKPASSVPVKIDPAQSFKKTKAGVYQCTANLCLRVGASTSKKKLEVMPKGSRVTCYGYYTKNGKTEWLLVIAASGKTGFCSTKYLERA